MHHFAVQGALVAAVLNLALAIIALARGGRRPLNRAFAFLSLTMCLWIVGNIGGLTRTAQLAVALLPLAVIHFAQILLHERDRLARVLLVLATGATLSLAAVVMSARTSRAVLAYLLMLYLVPVIGYVFQRVNRRRRVTRSRLERQQLGLLLTGGLAVLAGGGVEFARGLGLALPPLGSLGALVYVIAISAAIARFGLMDMSVFIGRASVLFVMTFMLFSLWGLLGGFWSDQRIASFFSILVATVAILIAYEPLRSLIERRADRVLQKQSFDLRNRLGVLGREISREIDQARILEKVARGLGQTDKIARYSIYLTAASPALELIVSHPDRAGPASLEATSALAELARQRKAPLVRDEVERELQFYLSAPRRQMLKSVFRTMQRLPATMTVPLLSQDRVIGLINVLARDPDSGFGLIERDMFMAVANQLALAVEKARMFQRAREQDRLALLGEMSSGLAHEVRNPLAVIKATAQLLGPGLPPAENAEFLKIIVQEVDRLNRVVSSFLDYARPFGSQKAPADIGQVLVAVADRTRQFAAGAISVTVETEDLPADVLIDREALERAVQNLVQNAVDALPNGGRILIRGRLSRHASLGEQIILTVSDTGPGIAEEHLPRLFDPFFTTRPDGTGLGLAIVHKIVESHGGTIKVRSVLGRGTTFQITLPRRGPEV